MTTPVRVDFWFGPGSRYSYLAATQLDAIALESGVAFRWRAVMSADLRERLGADPFARPTGQYAPDYRDRDVTRWAEHYGVPYVAVDGEPEDWRRLARACHAAEAMGAGWAFSRQLLSCVHAEARMPADDESLAVLAEAVGLPGAAFAQRVDWDQTQRAYEAALSEAVDQGVFGVSTFVTEAGELIFGQDRLPLLVDILERG